MSCDTNLRGMWLCVVLVFSSLCTFLVAKETPNKFPGHEGSMKMKDGSPMTENSMGMKEGSSMHDGNIEKKYESSMYEDSIEKKDGSPKYENGVEIKDGSSRQEGKIEKKDGSPLHEDSMEIRQGSPKFEDSTDIPDGTTFHNSRTEIPLEDPFHIDEMELPAESFHKTNMEITDGSPLLENNVQIPDGSLHQVDMATIENSSLPPKNTKRVDEYHIYKEITESLESSIGNQENTGTTDTLVPDMESTEEQGMFHPHTETHRSWSPENHDRFQTTDSGTRELLGELQLKVESLSAEWIKDRRLVLELEEELGSYIDITMKNSAEIARLQQETVEQRDQIGMLEKDLHLNNLDIQHLTYQQNQMTKAVEECCNFEEHTKTSLTKLDKRIRHLRKYSDVLFEKVSNLNKNYTKVDEQLADLKNSTAFVLNNQNVKTDIFKNSLPDENAPMTESIGQFFQTFEGSGQLEEEYLISNLVTTGKTVIETTSGEELGSGDTLYDKTDLQSEINTHGAQIGLLQKLYNDMLRITMKLETKVSSIQLGDFMQQLQTSVVNMTQNIITMEQWKVASSHIVNSTQTNQNHIMDLTHMIVNNTNKIGDLYWKSSSTQQLAQQQFNVLRMHIIQMNNSLQDMQEELQKQKRKNQEKPLYTNEFPGEQNMANLKSRLDNLALQVLFSDNRLSRLESSVLNESLFSCQKHGTDMYQNNKITRIEQEISQTKETTILLKDMVKRLDHGLYMVHSKSKNNSMTMKQLGTYGKKLEQYIPIIDAIQREILHFKYQLPTDCHGYYLLNYRESGIYVVHPYNSQTSIQVYCDLTDTEAWTTIQHRNNGSISFARTWVEYGDGFGSAGGEFWIGNLNLHLLTSRNNYTLRIEMVDMMGGSWVAEYDHFVVGSEMDSYRLSVSGYHGNSTDGFNYSNGMAFSTLDRDNDLSSTHCAEHYTAGWWYKHCQYSNLNGRYPIGIIWYNQEWNDWIQLKQTLMKIKHKS